MLSPALYFGERKALQSVTGERLSFNRVAQDSRCAQDVVCIWAGNTTLEFTLGSSDSPATLTFTMTTLPDGTTSTQFHGYDILVSILQPYPVSTSSIEPRDYSITVLVEPSPQGLPTTTPNAQMVTPT